MSQQKILFAVCLAAGLVALVTGQSMNVAKCTAQARDEFTKLVREATAHMQELSTDVTNHAANSFDIDGFNNEIQQLTQQYASYADMSQGMSANRLMETSYKIMQSYVSIFRYFVSSSAGLRMMGSYSQFAVKMVNSQTAYGMNVARGCMPSSGSK